MSTERRHTIHPAPYTGSIDWALNQRATADVVLSPGLSATDGAWWFTAASTGNRVDEFRALIYGGSVSGSGPECVLGFSAYPTRIVNGVNASYFELFRTNATRHSNYSIDARSTPEFQRHRDSAVLPVKALHVHGSGARISDVLVRYVTGDRKVLEGEGFGILVGAQYTGQYAAMTAEIGGATIERCRVEVNSGAYACGIYPGFAPELVPSNFIDQTVLPSVVRDCVVVCRGGFSARGHCGFGLNHRTRFERCTSSGLNRPFFSDTGSGADCVIEQCYADGASVALELRGSVVSDYRQRYDIRDSTFVLDGASGAGYVAGLVMADDTATKECRFGDIVFEGCRFVNASPFVGHVGSSTARKVTGPTVFKGCTFAGKWDRAQADAAGWVLTDCRGI